MRAWSRSIGAKPDSRASDSTFTFVLVKPTHYDDDGYPIQWFRSALPSNTLACMNSLAVDARERGVLGEGVQFHIETYDETNRRVFPSRIIRDLKKRGGRALIGIVGVQSNQFPRALTSRGNSATPAFRSHRRLPCLRLHRDASGDAERAHRRAGDGHLAVRGRIRGAPAGRCLARRLERDAEAAL